MFKSIVKSNIEQKSYEANDLSFFLLGSYDVFNSSNINKYISYYYKSSPLFTAIKLITDNINSIDIVLKDVKKDEFVYNHPVLELLENPNPFSSGDLFIEAMISNFLLSGDCFIEIIGSSRPVEIYVIPSQYVTINASTRDGYPDTYQVSSNTQTRTFKRKNKRYYSSNGNEIIHLKSYNPEYNSNNLRGVSYIQPIELEITQYLLASIHNNSTLKNQGRPSGILTYKGGEAVSDEATNRIKEGLQKTFSGAKNSGNTMFLGGDFDFKQLSESIKDMDFAKLKIQTQVAIYNALKIPLPMISPDHMSLANMETSKLNFYDNCVIPLLSKVLKFLNKELLIRYSESETQKLDFDESTILALRPRQYSNIETLKKSGVLTTNEIRSKLGYEDIEGGDAIYQPLNLIPIGQDKYTVDNRETPAKKNLKEDFVYMLKKQRDVDNNLMFSNDEVESLAQDYYG